MNAGWLRPPLKSSAFILLLFAAAFAVRLALVLALRDPNVGPVGIASADDVEFNNLALRLAHGAGYVGDTGQPTSFRAPGWPLLLAGFYAVFGTNPPGVYVLLCLLGAAGCVLTYLLAREFIPEAAARLAGVLAAVYLPYAYFSCSFLSEGLFVPQLLLGLLLLVRYLKQPSLLLLILAGLVLGWTALTRPFALLLLPMAWGVLLLESRRRRGLVVPVVLFTAAFAVVIAPWTVRNHVVHGRFVLIATNGGSTFYGGNNGRVVSEWRHFGNWISTTELPDRDRIVATPDEVSHDKMEWRLGIEWLREHKRYVPLLLVLKTARLCLWLPDFDGGSRFFLAVRALGYVPFLLLMICGGWVCLRDRSYRGPTWLVLHGTLLATLATAWIFWGSPRFRDANVGILMIYAALGAQWLFGRRKSPPTSGRKKVVRHRPALEGLECRLAPSVSVTNYHNDIASSGLNANETQLTPAVVAAGSFGKEFTTAVDGQVYAQPLVVPGANITSGPNTNPGATGVHDAVFVATENDSLYAIDANPADGGAVLWQRSFLDLSANDALPGATAVNPVTSTDVGTTDISPVIGITGTPVIDPAAGVLYVVATTKETVSGTDHFVQRLHAISLANGTDVATPYLIGDTSNGNSNNTQVYVYGSGDGSVTDPDNGTGNPVVQFNALTQNQRCALNLVNNNVYVSWASHGDNGPYHGWVVSWNVANLSTSGFQLDGVFNDSPNGGNAGIWMGGGQLAFEPDGSAFYFAAGNGPTGHGNPVLNAAGFPSDGDYYEALVKVVADASTTPTNQNVNGWGLKAADYFIPYNQVALDNVDQDFGSGGPMLLPAAAGMAGHLDLLVVAGKEGTIYLIDRNNLGKFDPNNDNVLNAVPDGSGHNTPAVQVSGCLNTPAYFNGTIYYVSGFSGTAEAFTIGSNGTLTATSQTAAQFGYVPGSPSVSANSSSDGIVWVMDRNANEIHAYDANSLATELWNSNQKASDAVGSVVKFAVPTVANGNVYVGTSNSLVAYGLTQPAPPPPPPPPHPAPAPSPPPARPVGPVPYTTQWAWFFELVIQPLGSNGAALGPALKVGFPYDFFAAVRGVSLDAAGNATVTLQSLFFGTLTLHYNSAGQYTG
jgi:4-amino-4-deoxy-L-arabinose transferase-like glycosyltransferase